MLIHKSLKQNGCNNGFIRQGPLVQSQYHPPIKSDTYRTFLLQFQSFTDAGADINSEISSIRMFAIKDGAAPYPLEIQTLYHQKALMMRVMAFYAQSC